MSRSTSKSCGKENDYSSSHHHSTSKRDTKTPNGSSKPRNVEASDAPRLSSKRRSSTTRCRLPSVTFSVTQHIVEVPPDQLSPQDVWNVYSPVSYVSKKEQRRIQKQREVHAQDLRECCRNLVESVPLQGDNTDSGIEAARKLRPTSSDMATMGYGTGDVACISLIISLSPLCPVSILPVMTPKVERAIEALFKGVAVCIFNEILNVPMRCSSAFRILRNIDGDEGCIAIFSSDCDSLVEGYIPISYIQNVTRGLEPIERVQYIKNSEIIQCSADDGKGQLYPVDCRRAFTLHCTAAQRFYVTFVPFTDDDLNTWLLATEYFALVNSVRRAYECAQ